MQKILFYLILCYSIQLSAQDTLTFMHYNILNYGNTTSFCPESKYPMHKKNEYTQIITNHVKPDILTFNEMSPEQKYHDSLLNRINNTSEKSYKLAPVTNLAKSNIVNLLFYNENKIGLHSAKVIRHSLRDINVYRLFYDKKMLQPFDTVYFTCIVAHLKAGSTKEDENTRVSMAETIIQWLEERGSVQNYFLMGDFNLYSSNEKAYQTLTSEENSYLQFFDPINKEGVWHDDSTYAGIHTQSTHLIGDCFAGGGLDDRFDFILFNSFVKEKEQGMGYVQNSYQALGNNGSYFNDSVYYSENSILPENVMNALYSNSDHLPVLLKVYIDDSQLQSIKEPVESIEMEINNPVKDILQIKSMGLDGDYDIQIRNVFGHLFFRKEKLRITTGEDVILQIMYFPSGIYVLTIKDRKGFSQHLKFIKI